MSSDRCKLVRRGLRGILYAAICVFGSAGLSPVGAQPCTVTLAWDANVEVDLAGYVLSQGLVSGVYPTPLMKKLPKTQTSVTVELSPGQRAFFALRAFDTAGRHSLYSNEVSDVCGVTIVVRIPAILTGVSATVLRGK